MLWVPGFIGMSGSIGLRKKDCVLCVSLGFLRIQIVFETVFLCRTLTLDGRTRADAAVHGRAVWEGAARTLCVQLSTGELDRIS